MCELSLVRFLNKSQVQNQSLVPSKIGLPTQITTYNLPGTLISTEIFIHIQLWS